jgi:uncharacterized spore protein YtfJ
MDTRQTLSGVQTALGTHRVFGAPIHSNGSTIIPAASIRGGGAGGSRDEQHAGAGFGLRARPVGVYVLHDGKVSWRPAVDITRLIAGGQLVALVLMLSPLVRRWWRARRVQRPWPARVWATVSK